MEKIEVSAQQRANAIEARDRMWPSISPEAVTDDLREWGYESACGAVACFGGWCSQWPAFRAQGVRPFGPGFFYPVIRDRRRAEHPGLRDVGMIAGAEVCVVLFGVDTLFDVRKPEEERGSEHQIVSRRLDRLIENSYVVEKIEEVEVEEEAFA